jgi:hypothetical protein
VRALIDDPDVRRALLVEIDEADLGSPRVREIVRAVKRLDGAGDEVTWPRVGAEIGDEARDALTFIAALSHPPVSEEAGRGCLSTMRAARIGKQMTDIQRSLQSCSAEEQDDLLRRKLALKKQIEALRGAPV